MRNFSGALTMGLIIAATTGLVATYAFAADDTAGSNAPAQVQSAPADNNANGSAANPSNADNPANTQNNADSGNSTNGDKASQAQTPNNDMNKSDNAAAPSNNSDQTGQAATPNANDQSAQSQQPAMKKHMAMSRHHIEVIQAALANSGQNVDVDGIWGPKTTGALKDFQRAHGLKATGHLDSKTRHALPLPPKST